jgi:hypothetical protein
MTSSVGEHLCLAPTSAPKSAPKETLGRGFTRYRRSGCMRGDEERLTRFDITSKLADASGVNQDAAPPLNCGYVLTCENRGAVRRSWARFNAFRRSTARHRAPRLLPARRRLMIVCPASVARRDNGPDRRRSRSKTAPWFWHGTGGCADGYVNQNNYTNQWANFGAVCTTDGTASIVLERAGRP